MQADTQADLFGAPSAPRQTLPLPGTQARRVLERLVGQRMVVEDLRAHWEPDGSAGTAESLALVA